LSDAKHNFDGLWRLIIWFFLCPQLIWILVFSFLRSTVLRQGGQLFRECRKKLMSFLPGILQIRSMFWNQISSFKDHVYSSLVVEMKSEMLVFESIFWNSSFFDQRSNTRYSMQSFDCLVFWKQKWFVVRLKWLFSWFFVSVLTFDLGYFIWWSAMRWPSVNYKKQKAQVKTWGFIKKWLLSFLAPILSAFIITSSLINEAMTLMEKLFKFWERHLSVQIAYLIKKGF